MNMKRRNADCGKLRRPLKRSKITEGIYGSTFLYLKFLIVWALVLMADFILEFRFEYLWPFWLLLRSVYDSFKYQGLAFSVFFVCIAITSDVICYLFIPVQWLFFAASTYVWVQYVWHTDRGICLPTVSLWLLFVYIEGSVRLRELKSLPFHLDLCRPFASHCIGYPVVTLGFGFKSYVSYRLRIRKQKDVQKENDFYKQFLQQALPPEQQNVEKHKALPSKAQEEVISNGVANSTKKSSSTPANKTETEKDNKENAKQKQSNTQNIEDIYNEQILPKRHNVNNFEEENSLNDQNAKTFKANGVTAKSASKLNSHRDNNSSSKKGKSNNSSNKENTANSTYTNNKDETITRLESDVKRLKADLQSSRNCEQELRSQLNTHMTSEKTSRSELIQLRQDNESLQNKLHNLVTSRQQDKQNITALEKKIVEERKSRTTIEQQLSTERKAKKAEEAAAARAVAMATAARGECTDGCKIRRRELENETKQIRREIKLREDQFRQLERETQTLRQYKEAQNETDVLMSALAAMQDKNLHLEKSLSSETRLKLDLFSALGEAKRQIEIQQGLLLKRDQEVAELKSKVAEVMALMPATSSAYSPPSSSSPSPHFSGNFAPPPQIQPHPCQVQEDGDVLVTSSLNPNASDYTPKGSQ